jgi:hypothetical protein
VASIRGYVLTGVKVRASIEGGLSTGVEGPTAGPWTGC